MLSGLFSQMGTSIAGAQAASSAKQPEQPAAVDMTVPVPGKVSLPVQYGQWYEHLDTPLAYVADALANGAKTHGATDFFMGRALQGQTLDEQEHADTLSASAQKADEIASSTIHLDDAQFEEVKGRLEGELGATPKVPHEAALSMPTAGQSLLALAGTVLAGPQHGGEIAASPFQYQLGEQAKATDLGNKQFAVDLAEHGKRLSVLQDLAQLQDQRDFRVAQLQNDALNRGERQRGNLLAIARSIEADTDRLTPDLAHAHFERLRSLYTSAGHPELAPSADEEKRTVEGLKATAELKRSMTDRDSRRKLIIPLVAQIQHGGDSAARGLPGQILKGIIKADPEGVTQMGYDPAKLYESIDKASAENTDDKIKDAKLKGMELKNEYDEKSMAGRLSNLIKQGAFLDARKAHEEAVNTYQGLVNKWYAKDMASKISERNAQASRALKAANDSAAQVLSGRPVTATAYFSAVNKQKDGLVKAQASIAGLEVEQRTLQARIAGLKDGSVQPSDRKKGKDPEIAEMQAALDANQAQQVYQHSLVDRLNQRVHEIEAAGSPANGGTHSLNAGESMSVPGMSGVTVTRNK